MKAGGAGGVGDAVCRPGYEEVLRAYYAPHLAELCEDCRRRFETAPMRLLDCKREHDRALAARAPRILDHLCDPCREHFARVRVGLEALGVPYVIDHRLVRGFDYYTRTTFEFAADALDAAQNGVGGGGRYDGLVELLGGDPTPGIGFGIGLERVLLACDAESVFATDAPLLDAYVIDTAGGETAVELTAELRRAGGFAKEITPFEEFTWADFLRRRIKAKLVEDDFDAALNKALELARSPASNHLPGWCGPSSPQPGAG